MIFSQNNIKKNFILPESLIRRADKISKKKGLNFSEFTRIALEEYVKKAEKEDIEKQLADACLLYYDEDQKIASKWRTAEGKI